MRIIDTVHQRFGQSNFALGKCTEMISVMFWAHTTQRFRNANTANNCIIYTKPHINTKIRILD